MSDSGAVVDTNILVYAHYQDSQYYERAHALVIASSLHKDIVYVTPQIIAEFYAVITNRKRVSNPYQPFEALEAIDHLLALRHITLLPLPVDIVNRWMILVGQHPVKGNDIFDLQIIATMLGNGVYSIYTFNRVDFEKFDEIKVLTP